MTFAIKDLALVRNTGVGPRLWSFNTNDSAGFVKGVGYFNAAWPQLRVGDIVFCECGDGSLTTMDFIAVVLASSSSAVTIASKTVDL